MNITILGAGAYGLGLALRFNKNKNKIVVWSAVESEIDELIKTRMNKKALPDVLMPNNIIFTCDIKKALEGSNIVVIAVATKFLSSVCDTIKPYAKDKHIVIASKGIEQDSYMFASQIVRKKLKTKKLCTISGPSFAKDMANDDLVALTLATKNNKTKELIIESLENDKLKLEFSKDIIGVELCGVLKNIIAIASGILEGLKVSESTKAMFLTKSLNECKNLIIKFGGSKDTILTYAGFGDILLTCTSESSRNYLYGKLIGENTAKEKLEEYLKKNTTEGVYTLKSFYELLNIKNIRNDSINNIYDIVFNKKDVNELIRKI